MTRKPRFGLSFVRIVESFDVLPAALTNIPRLPSGPRTSTAQARGGSVMSSLFRRGGVAVLSLLIALTAMTLRPGLARASSGSAGMDATRHLSGSVYGSTVTVWAQVWDASDSCSFPWLNCDMPAGRVDFYAVQGSIQTFLTSADLTGDSNSELFNGGFYTITNPDFNYQLVTCCLEPGSYDAVRAYYVPGNFDPLSVDTAGFTIRKADSLASVGQSSATTAVGQPVTFTIHVSSFEIADDRAAKPSGFVDLREGNTIYGTKTIDADGNATITTSALSAGSHDLKAYYAGDGHYEASNAGSSESVAITHVVNVGATTNSLAASDTSITYGDSVTFTDTVAPVAPASGSPSGSVLFLDGGTSFGTQPLNEANPDTAALSTSSLGVGSHTISTTYAGDDSFTGSQSNSVTVNVARAATSTVLGSSTNPSAFGQGVTFTASVSGPGTTTPTGTVQFRDGSTAIGAPQSVIAGVASLTIGSLAGGSHSISAVYSGNANLLGSTSNTVAQVVTCDRTITGSVSSISVTSGSTCLSGAKLSGNVTVSGSGSLSIVNSTISGGVTVTGGSSTAPTGFAPTGFVPTGHPAVTICGSTVAGNVTVTGESGFVLIGDTADDACAGNWLKGSVTLSGNSGGLALADNRIGGFVNVTNNVGAGPSPNHVAPIVAANVVGGFLLVSGNSPAATDGGRPNYLKMGQLVSF